MPLTLESRKRDWSFAWEWEARKAALLAKPEPQQRAPPPVAGRRLFFKVNGRAWREVELERPCSAEQWARLRAHLEQGRAAAASGGGEAAGGQAADESARAAEGAELPRKGRDGQGGQGKGSRGLRKGGKEKGKPKTAGAAAKGAAAAAAAAQQQQEQQQQQEEAEGPDGWWQARCTALPGEPESESATRLLIRLTAATQWEQWAPVAPADGGEGGKGGGEKTGSGKKRKRPASQLQAECADVGMLKVLGPRARARARS